MAPEQVKGLETDARSDIYALGMMLYEVLTGKTPFDTDNEFELMKLQTEATPVPPGQINPNIPEEVEAAIMQAIAKHPDERFQTAGDFLQELLDAGYSTTGTMRGLTGAHRMRPNTKSSQSPILKAQAGEIKKASKEIKQTRLGDAPTVRLPPLEAKATRLETNAKTFGSADTSKATRLSAANQTIPPQNLPAVSTSAPSFFSKLTWVHYVGAGVAGLFLIGLLAAVPLFLSGGNSKVKTEEMKSPETSRTRRKKTGSKKTERGMFINRRLLDFYKYQFAPKSRSVSKMSKIIFKNNPIGVLFKSTVLCLAIVAFCGSISAQYKGLTVIKEKY